MEIKTPIIIKIGDSKKKKKYRTDKEKFILFFFSCIKRHNLWNSLLQDIRVLFLTRLIKQDFYTVQFCNILVDSNLSKIPYQNKFPQCLQGKAKSQ